MRPSAQSAANAPERRGTQALGLYPLAPHGLLQYNPGVQDSIEMYTARLLDHYRHPRNEGHLDSPDLAAEEYNPLCGDRITIQARLEGGRVVEARFKGRGCALCLGAASILTEAIQGRTLEELFSLDREAFLQELQSSIRPARLKCALLPWMAFRRAAFGEDEWPL